MSDSASSGEQLASVEADSWTYMGVLSNLAFYPTLFYNVVMNKITTWPWYTRIDETVILGALPFKSQIPELLTQENVGGVVCLNLPHEVMHSWVAKKEESSVQYYWLPVPDFTYAPKAADIVPAIQFIKSFENTGKSVYIHCKAGRTRSATVLACYLMEKHKWHPDDAFTHIKGKRPQTLLRHAHWQALEDFAKLLDLPPRAK